MDQHQYRLLEPNDNYKEAVIEKNSITATFTIAEVEAMKAHNEKSLRETEGQLSIKKAEIVNIDHFHPMIKDLTGEQLAAAWIYKEALDYINKAEPIIESLNAAIADNDATIAAAMEIVGIKAVDPVTNSIKNDEQAA